MHTLAANDLLGRCDTGAVDQPVQPTERLLRLRERRPGVVFTGDVGAHEAGAFAQLGNGLLAGLGIDIQQHHLAALPDQFPGAGQTQAGGAAAD